MNKKHNWIILTKIGWNNISGVNYHPYHLPADSIIGIQEKNILS